MNTAALWSFRSLRSGKVLWRIGQNAGRMAMVVSGELSVLSEQHVEFGTIRKGELIGEATIFIPGSIRSATLVAKTETKLLILARNDLLALRQRDNPVYLALLEQGLLTAVRRVRVSNKEIALRSRGGVDAPVRSEPSVLARLWKGLRPGGPTVECPPLVPLLKAQPGLEHAPSDALEQLAASFAAQSVEEGTIICLEGDPGDAAYIVASGEVAVLRHVRGNRAELLATLRVKSQFGFNTLVESGPRTASCVANKVGWLYRMDEKAYKKLKGKARLVWLESMLTALDSQMRNANAALQRTLAADGAAKTREAQSQTKAAPTGGFQALLQASGYLEGWSDTQSELDEVKVVKTDEQVRNRYGPKR